jgi:TonB family protein
MARPALLLGLADTPPKPAEARLGRGLALSLAAHVVLAALLLLRLTAPPERAAISTIEPPVHLVFLQAPGPSGGAGGAPAARPALKPPAPKPAAAPMPPPPPIPVTPPLPTPTPVTPPPPTLVSMLTVTADATAFQVAPVTISGPGGPGGRGAGDKPGPGAGDGPPGPGAGDGPGGPGSGLTDPQVLRRVSPEYSGHAMVSKIEGTVGLEVEIETNGTVGKARVTKSLDPSLDEEALKAARQWLFIPAKRNGAPVATLVTLLLDFHLR